MQNIVIMLEKEGNCNNGADVKDDDINDSDKTLVIRMIREGDKNSLLVVFFWLFQV